MYAVPNIVEDRDDCRQWCMHWMRRRRARQHLAIGEAGVAYDDAPILQREQRGQIELAHRRAIVAALGKLAGGGAPNKDSYQGPFFMALDMRRGDIWTVSGGKDYASKPRPVVIVQDDAARRRAS